MSNILAACKIQLRVVFDFIIGDAMVGIDMY